MVSHKSSCWWNGRAESASECIAMQRIRCLPSSAACNTFSIRPLNLAPVLFAHSTSFVHSLSFIHSFVNSAKVTKTFSRSFSPHSFAQVAYWIRKTQTIFIHELVTLPRKPEVVAGEARSSSAGISSCENVSARLFVLIKLNPLGDRQTDFCFAAWLADSPFAIGREWKNKNAALQSARLDTVGRRKRAQNYKENQSCRRK